MSAPPSAGPLLRLTEHIDDELPQLLVIALIRRGASVAARPLLYVGTCAVTRAAPRSVHAAWRRVQWAKQPALTVLVMMYCALSAYMAADAWKNTETLPDCAPRRTPRPVGIGAAIALVCFLFTVRFSVSSFALIALIAAKERSALTGIAALVTVAEWMGASTLVPVFYAVLLAAICMAAAAHGAACASPAGASLSLACFVYMQLWLASWFVSWSVSRLAKRGI